MLGYLQSTFAQFRCGYLSLRIETDRYHGEPFEERFCSFCSENSVEIWFYFYYTVVCIIITEKTSLNTLDLINSREG